MNTTFSASGILKSLTYLYILNRVSYFAHELLKSYIYYDFSHYYFDIETHHIHHMSDFTLILIYLVPFIPYFIFGWSPIIVLNAALITINYMYIHNDNTKAFIKHHFSAILLLYLIASLIFILMSGLKGYDVSEMNCDNCMFEIFLEGYTPYAPQLICGFVFGNVLSIVFFLVIKLAMSKTSENKSGEDKGKL